MILALVAGHISEELLRGSCKWKALSDGIRAMARGSEMRDFGSRMKIS
jgi:hypothetical protein